MAIGTKVNDNTTVLTDIKNQVNELHNRRTDIDIGVNVNGSSLISAQQTRANSATTRVEIELQLEPPTVRNEIRSELMLLMTGQGPYASSVNALLPSLSRLSHQDRTELANMLLINHLQHPNNPRKESNFSAARSPANQPLASVSPICGCNIKTYNTGKAFKRGLFPWGYGYQNQRRHHTSCPYNREEGVKHTWRYQLCMQLLPFANKTVQFAFSATAGQGGLDLRFPLKVIPTVQRSRSAIFNLFDEFPVRCGEFTSSVRSHGSLPLYLTWKTLQSHSAGGGSETGTFIWDIDRVREELRHIHRKLSEAHKFQLYSIRDVDESGYTVLHVSCCPPIYTDVLLPISCDDKSRSGN